MAPISPEQSSSIQKVRRPLANDPKGTLESFQRPYAAPMTETVTQQTEELFASVDTNSEDNELENLFYTISLEGRGSLF